MRRLSTTAAIALSTLLALACSDPGSFDGDGGGDTAPMPDGMEGEVGADGGGDSGGSDACAVQRWYRDEDGDGFGEPGEFQESCEQPEGFVANSDDCDDEDEEVNPEAEETCDGVDENCNGVEDTAESAETLEAANCETQRGVCEGATTAACASGGEEYAECGAEEFGADYVEAGDEGWRCDGMDNDCDGSTDEACCSSGETPNAVPIGDPSADQSLPVVVPAARGAPSEARFLVAWAAGREVKLAHVDGAGVEVGSVTKSLVGDVQELEVVSHSSGYAVFAVNGADQLQLLRFDGSLSQQGSKKTVNQDPSPNLAAPSAAVQGQTAWVAYSFRDMSLLNSQIVIKAAAVNLSNGDLSTQPLVVSQSGNELPEVGKPEVAVVGGTPTAVWWQARSGNLDVTLRGARLQSGGTINDRFSTSIKGTSGSGESEPVAATEADGAMQLVYPDFSSGTGVLNHLEVGTNETGTLSGATQITGDSQTNRQPAAAAVDADGDGTDDRLVVAWAQGSTSDPAIQVGQTELSNPSMISGRTVVQTSDDENPTLALSDGRIGATWLDGVDNGDSDTADDVKYAPVSIDGPPVCTPGAS